MYKLFRDATSPTGYSSNPTILVSFNGTNGSGPQGGLIADAAGNPLGASANGGTFTVGTEIQNSKGAVFEVVRDDGNPTGYRPDPLTLATFDSTAPGASQISGLVADSQGNFFGVTPSGGGAYGAGTVYEVARIGTDESGAPVYTNKPTVLVSFGGDNGGTNGGNPLSGVLIDSQGQSLWHDGPRWGSGQRHRVQGRASARMTRARPSTTAAPRCWRRSAAIPMVG